MLATWAKKKEKQERKETGMRQDRIFLYTENNNSYEREIAEKQAKSVRDKLKMRHLESWNDGYWISYL